MTNLPTSPPAASSYRRTRNRLALCAGVVALAATSLLVAATPGSARAASLPKSLAKFAHCPVDVTTVQLCLFSSTTSTTFQIGSTVVSSTSPATISLGIEFNKKDQPIVVLPDDGSPPLQSPAIPLPGGLLGIPGVPDGGALAVTVTPQSVGVPTLNFANLLQGTGPGLTLPIDVLVSTPTGLLGPDCTIADASDPITLNLTTGRTNPPPPNTPIKGVRGTISSKRNGTLKISDMKLVDNAFAVPGAYNCGSAGILDPILNLDKGLPSAAGTNSAILSGSSYTAPASLIRQYVG